MFPLLVTHTWIHCPVGTALVPSTSFLSATGAAADAEPYFSTASLSREIHVTLGIPMRNAPNIDATIKAVAASEVEDASPSGDRILINPRRDAEVRNAANNPCRNADILAGSLGKIDGAIGRVPSVQVAPFISVPFQPLPVASAAVVPLVSSNKSCA